MEGGKHGEKSGKAGGVKKEVERREMATAKDEDEMERIWAVDKIALYKYLLFPEKNV